MPSGKRFWSRSKGSSASNPDSLEDVGRSESIQADFPTHHLPPDQNYRAYDPRGESYPQEYSIDPSAAASEQLRLQVPPGSRGQGTGWDQNQYYDTSPQSPVSGENEKPVKKSFREKLGLYSDEDRLGASGVRRKPSTSTRRKNVAGRSQEELLEQDSASLNRRNTTASPKQSWAGEGKHSGEENHFNQDLIDFARSTSPDTEGQSKRRSIFSKSSSVLKKREPQIPEIERLDSDSPYHFENSSTSRGTSNDALASISQQAPPPAPPHYQRFGVEPTEDSHQDWQTSHQRAQSGQPSSFINQRSGRGDRYQQYDYQSPQTQRGHPQEQNHPYQHSPPQGASQNVRQQAEVTQSEIGNFGVSVPSSTLQPPQHNFVDTNEPPTPNVGYDNETGAATPPPMRAVADMSDQDINQLMKEHRDLKEKYSKVKRYYFEKEGQVTQLQNALAHQRLSQSRTSLDDGEYCARLTRLDGLIAQIAFGFRKDWTSIPTWLQPVVNKDALTIGKQEMTAVGRAFISRWLADEVLDRYFHPGLDTGLSTALKTVQKNIRSFSPPLHTLEEEEALTTRITSWRLATMDGLQQALTGSDAAEQRQIFTSELSHRLLSALQDHLIDPPPAGLDNGVNMIIELVISILTNLPLESRDVHIEYYLPGQPIIPDLMKQESGIPALASPAAEQSETDKASMASQDADAQDTPSESTHDDDDTSKESEPKKSFLGGLMGGSKKTGPGLGTPKGTSAAASQTSLSQAHSSSVGQAEDSARVRMCVFLSLQVRGKRVLAQAPVFVR